MITLVTISSIGDKEESRQFVYQDDDEVMACEWVAGLIGEEDSFYWDDEDCEGTTDSWLFEATLLDSSTEIFR